MAKILKQKGWKTLTFFVEPAIRSVVIELANKERLTVSDILRRALREYLEKAA
jgi:hypothetical protein